MGRMSLAAHRHGLDDDRWFVSTGARADVTAMVWKKQDLAKSAGERPPLPTNRDLAIVARDGLLPELWFRG
jgi:hypothetical protein